MSPKGIVDLIEGERVTFSAGVPTVWLGIAQYLADHPEADVSSIEGFLCGGSAVPKSLAVIGPNGAGKSTFLQVLAGIMRPTEGTVDVRGQVSGLLGLGVGFDVELSGVENILLGGAFLGLDGPRIRELLPSIVEFADLGQFIDAPLKTYSSGMRARLGLRDRDRGRPGHPAARRGPRDGRRELPGQVEGARHRARARPRRRWSS